MKYCYFIILIFFMLTAGLFAQSESKRFNYISIKNVSPGSFAALLAYDIDIENVKNKNEIFAHVTDEQLDQLKKLNYQVEAIVDRSKIYADSLWLATQFSSNPLAAYHTFDELTAELQQLAQGYPEICLLESIGKSTQGRDLWMMKITDKVAIEEYEPEFKYISSMHGDEPVGMEMCIYLIKHLLENYGADPKITGIVNETEIWIMPLMNPDGYILRQRRNYHSVDLNRNFPDRIMDPNDTPVGREPETQAVMNFSRAHSFVLSANFHTGALVANYPYDSNSNGQWIYSACPDDALFIELAKTYSSRNLTMWQSSEFRCGITNGADWYVMYGGMQDWNYVWLGDNELTIELSNVSWPNASLLPSFWDDNREAMLAYIEAIHWGVRGFITDVFSGQPLAATIEVAGIDHAVYSDPNMGDYYRMLLPGTYQFRFAADGYWSQEFDSVLVVKDYITHLDVPLIPEQSYNITGIITDQVSDAPISARLNFIGDLKFSTTADSLSGAFQITLPADTYELEIRNDRYVTQSDTLIILTDLHLNYELQPYVFVLDLDFEKSAGDLVASDTLWQWGEPTCGPEQPYSGQKLWGTILNGSYPNDANAKLVLPAITLPDVDHLIFSFWHWMEAETDAVSPDSAYDGGIVELSNDRGISWIEIFPLHGYPHTVSKFAESAPFLPGTPIYSGQYNWTEVLFDLDVYKGKTVQIRFYFGSDKDNDYPYAGWYLDDVAIKYPYHQTDVNSKTACLMPEHFWLSQNYPNPFNGCTAMLYSLPRENHIRIAIYNVNGQTTQILFDSMQKSGSHRISWDGNDDQDQPVSSGVYIIEMKCGDEKLTRKALLLR